MDDVLFQQLAQFLFADGACRDVYKRQEEGRSPLVFFRIVVFISGKFFVTNFLRPDPCGMGENELGRIALRRIQDDA